MKLFKEELKMKTGHNSKHLFDTTFLSQLQDFQSRFCSHFGVAALIFNPDGSQITQPSNFSEFCTLIRSTDAGLKLCMKSKSGLFGRVANGKPAIYNCSVFPEFADAVVPVIWEDEVVAACAVGQLPIMSISRESVNKRAVEIGVDPDELWAKSQLLKVGTTGEFNRCITFLDDVITLVMRMREQDIELTENLDRFGKIMEIVAHNVREELLIILGFIKLLDDRYGPEMDTDFKKFVFYIVEYSERLKEMAELLIDICENR